MRNPSGSVERVLHAGQPLDRGKDRGQRPGSGGSVGSGGTGGSGGAAGMGGEVGTGGGGGAGLPSAAEFCDDFEAICSYGSPNYDDRADCLADYDSYEGQMTPTDQPRQECVSQHLGLAEGSTGATRDLHCGHASGLNPCD